MTTYEDKDGWEKTLTTCNYATSNLIGYSVYTVGETAARCKTGTNPDYPGLCSVAEAIDVNSYWLATVARIAKENNSKNRK